MSGSLAERSIVGEALPSELLRLVDERRKRLERRKLGLVLTQPVASLLWLAVTVSLFFVDPVFGMISLIGGGALCVALIDRANGRMNDRLVDVEKLETIRSLLTLLQDRTLQDAEVWMEAELFSLYSTDPVDKEGVRWSYAHKWLSARWQQEGGRSIELYLTRNATPGKSVADERIRTSNLQVCLRSTESSLRANAIVCPEGWELVDRKSQRDTQVFDFLGQGEAAADNLLATLLATIDSQEAWDTRL